MTKRTNRVVPHPTAHTTRVPCWGNGVDDEGLVKHLMQTERQFPGDAGAFMFYAAPGPIQLQQSIHSATH